MSYYIYVFIIVFIDIILIQLHLYNNTRWFNLWFIKGCHHSLHSKHFPCFLRYPFWEVEKVVALENYIVNYSTTSFSYLYIMLFILLLRKMIKKKKTLIKRGFFFIIFRLLFITGSSSPSIHVGVIQRLHSGIIF